MLEGQVNTNLFYKPTDLCPTQDVAGLCVYIHATSNRTIPEQARGGTDMPSGYLQQFHQLDYPVEYSWTNPQYLDVAVVKELTGMCIQKTKRLHGLPTRTGPDRFSPAPRGRVGGRGCSHMFDPLYWVKHHSDGLILSSFSYSVVVAGVSCLGDLLALEMQDWPPM